MGGGGRASVILADYWAIIPLTDNTDACVHLHLTNIPNMTQCSFVSCQSVTIAAIISVSYNPQLRSMSGKLLIVDISLFLFSVNCWSHLIVDPSWLLISVVCWSQSIVYRDVWSLAMTRPKSESRPFCCLLKALWLNLWVHKTCFVLAQVPRNKGWKRNIIKAINLVIFCSVFPFIKPNWRFKLLPKILLQWNYI